MQLPLQEFSAAQDGQSGAQELSGSELCWGSEPRPPPVCCAVWERRERGAAERGSRGDALKERHRIHS